MEISIAELVLFRTKIDHDLTVVVVELDAISVTIRMECLLNID